MAEKCNEGCHLEAMEGLTKESRGSRQTKEWQRGSKRANLLQKRLSVHLSLLCRPKGNLKFTTKEKRAFRPSWILSQRDRSIDVCLNRRMRKTARTVVWEGAEKLLFLTLYSIWKAVCALKSIFWNCQALSLTTLVKGSSTIILFLALWTYIFLRTENEKEIQRDDV